METTRRGALQLLGGLFGLAASGVAIAAPKETLILPETKIEPVTSYPTETLEQLFQDLQTKQATGQLFVAATLKSGRWLSVNWVHEWFEEKGLTRCSIWDAIKLANDVAAGAVLTGIVFNRKHYESLLVLATNYDEWGGPAPVGEITTFIGVPVTVTDGPSEFIYDTFLPGS